MVFRGVAAAVACFVVLGAPSSPVSGDGRGTAPATAAEVNPGAAARTAVRHGQESSAMEVADRCEVSPGASNETIVAGRLLLSAAGAERGAIPG